MYRPQCIYSYQEIVVVMYQAWMSYEGHCGSSATLEEVKARLGDTL